jgi:cytoskeletal protein CcmA (bactofilin family)
MWNRRKEEEAPKPVATPTPVNVAREGIPMSTQPVRPAEPVRVETPRAGNAVLGKSVVVKGQIFGREDLTIDGEVEGTVELQEHRLTVGSNGKVTATVKAREVVVQGTVHGNIETREKIEIRKDARVVGDIRTARIVIEDGAYFKGNIDIVRAEVPKAAAPKPQATATAPNPTGSAIAAGAGDAKR